MLSASIFKKVDQWLEDNNEQHRGHLGFSVIGDDDEHKLWMNFHWCLPNSFEGRMLRLFDLGNRIEDQVVENIRDSKVMAIASHDKDGNQFRASTLGGHFSGSCDGLLRAVLPPPDEEEVILLEIKSANDKRWNELEKLGDYELWSETYRWQIHGYMGVFGLTKCMVVVVNKNNSKIYSQIIEYNPGIWEKAQERAERIIGSDSPIDKGRKSEKDWRLKGESKTYFDIYFRKRFPESVNCRNCAFSKPLTSTNGATWICTRSDKVLDIETQRSACKNHLWNPKLINTAVHIPEESDDTKIAYEAGVMKFYNAIPEARVAGNYYSSSEMRELSKGNFDPGLMKIGEDIKNEFPGAEVENMDERKIPF
jgi:hypothetical protein|tara:strand:- start:498 stop:1595 length:1098 start_codon:yes stop_codon:yes gene_type:complete